MKVTIQLFLLTGLSLIIASPVDAQKLNYIPDTLKNGFEQLTIQQPDDYEGKVYSELFSWLAKTLP